MITSYIYIWGGFQNITLKDILLLHIFWLYGTIAIVWRLITSECKECNQEAKKFYFIFLFVFLFYHNIVFSERTAKAILTKNSTECHFRKFFVSSYFPKNPWKDKKKVLKEVYFDFFI